MSPQGLVVDPLRFAVEGATVAQSRPVVGFERLADALFDPAGSLTFSVRGSRDRDGKHWLALAVAGTLTVQCQRCLEALDWALQVDNRLLLVPEGREMPEEELQEDGWDCLPVGPRLDLLELIEDEALLALPFAPRHDDCCAPSMVGGGGTTSPFAGLARLRKPEG
ncbi:MAG: DUF177 domain-containing protein [Rhodocyclaceae bacterium]|nr:DUF177 domain-containing protein [Rhodocyclaceae bacterium]